MVLAAESLAALFISAKDKLLNTFWNIWTMFIS